MAHRGWLLIKFREGFYEKKNIFSAIWIILVFYLFTFYHIILVYCWGYLLFYFCFYGK